MTEFIKNFRGKLVVRQQNRVIRAYSKYFAVAQVNV